MLPKLIVTKLPYELGKQGRGMYYLGYTQVVNSIG